ncbi:unnamed protein product [Ceutorhynchus assimilis]|uniref:UDP-glucuronosyltransferase n=1 Tax=Ceutorhynchus assimilis TaxID=467358 RepID=A0A9N9QMS0_9CUCU|nr:unnamed protein product [Ceutorhynchus assimilis]
MKLLSSAVLIFLLSTVNSAKILFVSVTPSPSHQKPFQQVWMSLASAGHEMHVVTPNPTNITKSNLIQYDISEVYRWVKQIEDNFKDNIKYSLQKPNFIETFTKEFMLARGWHALHSFAFDLPKIQKLIRNKPEIDLVIVEWLSPTFAVFAEYFQAPLVGICSLGSPTYGLDAIGNYLNPIATPDQNIPLSRSYYLNFRDRLLSALYAFWIRVLYRFHVLPQEDSLVKKHFGQNMTYLGNIQKNISLLLLNRNQIFHPIMPTVPGIIEFGGFEYNNIKQTLDEDLKAFLDNASGGVIYFSLGAAIKQTRLLSEKNLDIFKKVLWNLDYKVLWKWENGTMDGAPDRVLSRAWINQTAVLAHPNVKLFITQGGLQSIEEAIAAHKPIIGIPFHSDQTTNVDTCVKYGMGKMMDLEDLSEVTLKNNILEIVNNPSYAENARKLDELMKDQPQDGLEKAIWWIEYVIRHKGARHLRSIAVDLPLWQYLMLDVFAFVFTVIFGFIFSVYVLAKLILRVAFGRSKKIKAE